ncbi:hypothetical protein D3C83_87990 [compost metagenome]
MPSVLLAISVGASARSLAPLAPPRPAPESVNSRAASVSVAVSSATPPTVVKPTSIQVLVVAAATVTVTGATSVAGVAAFAASR